MTIKLRPTNLGYVTNNSRLINLFTTIYNLLQLIILTVSAFITVHIVIIY